MIDVKKTGGKFFYLLFLISLCVGCEKKGNENIMYKDNGYNATHPVAENVPKKTKALQEQIENYDKEYVFLFQEEGNFTNSGDKEILAFYEAKSRRLNKEITTTYFGRVYCFICDELNQTIINAIEITGYGTSGKEPCLEKMPIEALGRKVLWLGKIFGYVGDFNNNGKEELYFFEVSNIGIYPRFYEFVKNDFKELLNDDEDYTLNLVNMDITNVDAKNKILTFEYKSGDKPPVKLAWNNETQLYERIK